MESITQSTMENYENKSTILMRITQKLKLRNDIKALMVSILSTTVSLDLLIITWPVVTGKNKSVQ